MGHVVQNNDLTISSKLNDINVSYLFPIIWSVGQAWVIHILNYILLNYYPYLFDFQIYSSQQVSLNLVYLFL